VGLWVIKPISVVRGLGRREPSGQAKTFRENYKLWEGEMMKLLRSTKQKETSGQAMIHSNSPQSYKIGTKWRMQRKN
jgi:hypothetical protein